MIRPIACVDTNILITLLDNTNDPDIEQEKTYIELTLERLTKQGARWIVPAPVVAELCKDGPGSEQIREVMRLALRTLRIEVLDEDAADIAGQMSRMTLKARNGRERGAVKYDALIAAIAHKIGARWLLTSNADDMRTALGAIKSTVQVVIATDPPETGQQVIVSVLKPGGATS
jgi:predicted nucleic acid-binding protein